MIALTMLWWSFLRLATQSGRNSKGDVDPDDLYTAIFTSLALGYAACGWIGLILIRASLTHVSISLICVTIAVATTTCTRGSAITLKSLGATLLEDLRTIIKPQYGSQYLWRLSGLITILILIVSIGPINQPDAIDYHVGYIQQFFIHGRNIKDGGLHQGLVGLGDFANLSFIQEHTTWLIRTAQIIALIPLVFFLARHHSKPAFVLTFLLAPVFIGWASVGKPMFLGDTCIAASYLVWRLKPSLRRATMVAITIICGISFKVSAMLITIPILIDMFYWHRRHRKIDRTLQDCCSAPMALLTALACTMLLTLFFYRQDITGNPFYPLASRLFTPHNVQAIDFEEYLRNFSRDSFLFPLSIILPTSLGLLASTLGPCAGLVCIKQIQALQTASNHELHIRVVAIGQIILLILFGQGRADYYAAPLILLIFGSGSIENEAIKGLLHWLGKTIFGALLACQLILFLTMAASSIYQSIAAIFSYETAMSQWAYGYDATNHLSSSPAPHLNLAFRTPRLFYKEDYVDQDRFNLCLLQKDHSKQTQSKTFSTCIRDLGVRSIMADRGILDDPKNFRCSPANVMLGQRNPFNNKRIDVDICVANQ